MGNLAYQSEYHEVKYELHDGKPVAMSPSPGMKHVTVADNILTIFKKYLSGKPCKVFSQLNVYLSKKDHFIPDAMIVCNKEIIKHNGIYGAPDLVVEVLSPSTSNYDRKYKKKIYEKSGVREYWLVETNGESIEVYLSGENGLELTRVYSIYPDWMIEEMTEDEKKAVIYEFTPSMFPDMKINIEEVFEY